MIGRSEPAVEFETHRARLVAVAGRVLGNRADAEDVVQEAWLRFARQAPGTVDNVAGWLTTVVGRLSIDQLRSRAAKAEVAFDARFLDPVVAVDDDGPEDNAIRAEALGLALLTVLGSLRPDERLAFVLHDLFAMPFAEIGPIIGKSTDAAKMTASRARRKVHGAATDQAHSRQQQRALVDAFLAAARDGDFDALLTVLDPDIVLEVHTARTVVVKAGRAEVIHAIEQGSRSSTSLRLRRVLVDGRPGILAWGPTGKPVALMACATRNGRITGITTLIDRSRLTAIPLPPPSEQDAENDGPA